MTKLLHDQVPVSAVDKKFMRDCEAVVPLIDQRDAESLEEKAKELIWGKDLHLTHPHANNVSWVLWDLAEGCYFDINKDAFAGRQLKALKRAIVDFNKGKIYPAHYVLVVMLRLREGKQIVESCSLSASVGGGHVELTCPYKEIIAKVQPLLPGVDSDPQATLKKFAKTLPKKINAWEIYESRVKSYLIESYATLGI